MRGAALALVAAAWAFALWSLLSVTWAEAPGRAVEGAGRNLLYAALVSLPLVTLPDRRSGVRMAWTLTAGLAAVVDPDLRQRADRRRRASSSPAGSTTRSATATRPRR